MAPRRVFSCIADDTALTTNISEIENWVSHGALTLVIPLYTLERLHLLKKDASQIGMNARKAVKFLDRITSPKDGLPLEPVVLQGPDEQYANWSEVESHFTEEGNNSAQAERTNGGEGSSKFGTGNTETVPVVKIPESAGGELSQMLLSKLNFAPGPGPASPNSTPPTSPSSSSPQSSKTSPEVKSASMTTQDISATPHVLKPLINSVVWYTYEKNGTSSEGSLFFLTNAADTAVLARKFGVIAKNIHQLRIAIGVEDQEIKNHDKYLKKHPTPPPTVATVVNDPEPKSLFRYDEEESDEEVVFQPRSKGNRGTPSARGTNPAPARSKTSLPRSPVPASTLLVQSTPAKFQIPIEEIDPDSFDRGSFARGSVPLINTSNHHSPGSFQAFSRGSSNRSGGNPPGHNRGGFSRSNRGERNTSRGSTRGRGQLFVP